MKNGPDQARKTVRIFAAASFLNDLGSVSMRLALSGRLRPFEPMAAPYPLPRPRPGREDQERAPRRHGRRHHDREEPRPHLRSAPYHGQPGRGLRHPPLYFAAAAPGLPTALCPGRASLAAWCLLDPVDDPRGQGIRPEDIQRAFVPGYRTQLAALHG